MSIESHYRINVARRVKSPARYIHYFRIDTTSEPDFQDVIKDMRRFYPEPEFHITTTYWECVGHPVTDDGDRRTA